MGAVRTLPRAPEQSSREPPPSRRKPGPWALAVAQMPEFAGIITDEARQG